MEILNDFITIREIEIIIRELFVYKEVSGALADVAQLVGALFCKLKGCGFDSWSGHMPRLWVQFPVGAHTRGNWSMLLSHIDVFLLFSLSAFISL